MNAEQKKGEKVHLMTGKTGNFSTGRGGIMIICGDVVSQLFYFCIAVIPRSPPVDLYLIFGKSSSMN